MHYRFGVHYLSVSARFDKFLSNITLTQAQLDAGAERKASVVRALNSHYWGVSSDSSNSKYVGSWGKFTRVRPPRDVDVLFSLPKSVYDRFQLRTGNRQSQLLQEVKNVLAASFPYTDVQGDGPVVKVPFSAYNVELIPAFPLTGGKYWVCMTDSGGRYKEADYDAEIKLIKDCNDRTKNNLRSLVRMMKCWQAYCSVPIKSFWIELIAVEFIDKWEYREKSSLYHDWMVRDFLKYLEGKRYGNVYAPGTYEQMYLGEAWFSKAQTARARAEKACTLEATDSLAAGDEWQKIFGTDIPKYL
jgi:hypothetical protein